MQSRPQPLEGNRRIDSLPQRHQPPENVASPQHPPHRIDKSRLPRRCHWWLHAKAFHTQTPPTPTTQKIVASSRPQAHSGIRRVAGRLFSTKRLTRPLRQQLRHPHDRKTRFRRFQGCGLSSTDRKLPMFRLRRRSHPESPGAKTAQTGIPLSPTPAASGPDWRRSKNRREVR